jgi:AraC-like DNA-binding protein
LELAVDRGASRDVLLNRSGLEASSLTDFDARVPLARHLAVIRAAKQECDDPAFALHYGEAVNLAEVSVVGLIGYASATILDAFVELSRYARLILDLDLGPGPRFTLEQESDGPWIIDRRPISADYLELTEIAFAQMVSGTRRFGSTPFVRKVQLSCADPGYASEYERVLGAPVLFECARNAMCIDPAWLSHQVAVEPRYVFGVLARHADEMLHQLDAAKTVRGRVEHLVAPVLHTGDVRVDYIARRLGRSRDGLYRSLKAEGVTFGQVVDELRHKLALEYLASGKVSINETAYLVGFSDPAAFSRAFKRWTGKRPGQMSR